MDQVPAMYRPSLNLYFQMLKDLQPLSVLDAIEQDTSVEQAYKELGINPLKLGIATVRGFLKIQPQTRTKLKEIATPQLALETLKYENPGTYDIIMRYGDRGVQYLKKWIEGALKILGVN